MKKTIAIAILIDITEVSKVISAIFGYFELYGICRKGLCAKPNNIANVESANGVFRSSSTVEKLALLLDVYSLPRYFYLIILVTHFWYLASLILPLFPLIS